MAVIPVNGYISIAELRATVLKGSGTGNDDQYARLIQRASRAIDRETHRHFYTLTATRDLSPLSDNRVETPNLVSVSALSTDVNLDRTFSRAWSSTRDYLLEPDQGIPANYFGAPYNAILVDKRNGQYTFPPYDQSVRVTGQFGFDAATSDTPTDLAGAINASVTTVAVDNAGTLGVGQNMLVDSEQLRITAIATNTLTVVRAINGTTAAAHSDEAVVNVYVYPDDIVECTLLLAVRFKNRPDAPFGVIEKPMTGFVTRLKEDEDIMSRLQPFIKYSQLMFV